jgi:hypothetical protein
MPTNPQPTSDRKPDAPEPHDGHIDRNAPAGSEDSLGAESIRDGRPATDDSVVEAIDEQDPAIEEKPEA